MKKSLIAAALVVSLSAVAVACDDGDEATPEPTTPAEAVESMAAEEVQDAEATMEAEAEDAEATMEADEAEVDDAEATMEAEAEDAVEEDA